MTENKKTGKRVSCGRGEDGGNPCVESPVYRLAFEDVDYLHAPFLRGTRLLLEYNKPERILRQEGISSTVVVFGSARTLPGDEARARLEEALARLDADPDNAGAQEAARIARRDAKMARWYEESRRFAAIVSRHADEAGREDFVVVTGGGPGIMEAANRGAAETGARSVGLNITLEHEQFPNPYISPELCFRFHYFAIRKMHFLMRARAMVAFPGGFGTMDELFEVLTLVQTGKVRRIPIVLVGREFWSNFVNFDWLVEMGTISPKDLELFTIADSADEAVEAIHAFYGGNPMTNGAV